MRQLRLLKHSVATGAGVIAGGCFWEEGTDQQLISGQLHHARFEVECRSELPVLVVMQLEVATVSLKIIDPEDQRVVSLGKVSNK